MALIATLAVATQGCGGGGDGEEPVTKSFETPVYPFTFEYPRGWRTTRDVGLRYGGAGTKRQLAVQFHPPTDQLVINQYRLRRKLAPDTPANQREVDRIVARLAKQARGTSSDAETITVGGLPGYRYVVDYTSAGQELRNTLIFVFRGIDEFQIICQSSPTRRSETERGCAKIIDTIEFI